MKKVVIITGQTATGKTKLALQKAREENGELINCDSRQVYKKLDIITGKDLTNHNFLSVKKENNFDIGYYELETINSNPVKIWLYDIVDPKKYFSSFDFQILAIPLISKIINRGKTPIIVGGTYFYLQHLLYGIETYNVTADWKLRDELNCKSVVELQKQLIKINKPLFDSLNNSDRNNPQRLIRKIEICRHSGKRSTSRIDSGVGVHHDAPLQLSTKLRTNIQIEYLGLRFKNKDFMHTAIKKRVEERLKNGAIEEVENLLKDDYTENDPGLKTIGYQQIIKYIQRKITKEQAIEEWRIREHQYTKRQYTFMKSDLNIAWQEV